ncbi:hypothetical protein LSH36_738g01042, partial [Paralvinella palmiformis]
GSCSLGTPVRSSAGCICSFGIISAPAVLSEISSTVSGLIVGIWYSISEGNTLPSGLTIVVCIFFLIHDPSGRVSSDSFTEVCLSTVWSCSSCTPGNKFSTSSIISVPTTFSLSTTSVTSP